MKEARAYGLILARGGSKGIPRKNIRVVNGMPLIGYTIQAARTSTRLSRVVVSTDDAEIAEIARSLGAEVPFIRPDHLASDEATDQSAFEHFVSWLKEHDEVPEFMAHLRPTTPLKTGEMIDEAIALLSSHPEFCSVRSVCSAEGVYHPYWMFRNQDGVLHPFIDGITLSEYYMRQLLPPCYRLNGVVDVFRSRNLDEGTMYGDVIGSLIIPEERALDIDTHLDLAWFEFLQQRSTD